MMIQSFLSRLPGALALFASSSLAFALTACGGNVIVDNSSGGSGAGGGSGGVATGGTTSPTTTTSTPTLTTATLDCPPGYTPCNNSYCADFANDSTNCGGCGAICSSGTYCQGGICVYPPDCVSCGQFITEGQGTLCPGTSQDLYDSLVNCVCAGVCAFQCSDNICTGQMATDPCLNCVQDTVNGCGNEFNECANDF